ncbi:glutamate--tRNA ligase [Streptomyces sp. NBC_01190]|uniref:glutamate--tRNA ligase n=1 Tax=Streptomyces sp. NBC_01190 TaxID=2903767 RepID=UPI00386CAA7C|nr:glutamate--tRNA ligase [Streptomyces sp. NBC_01190]
MFHVGGARSALYNWAVARQSGGTFVLRIEDTDAARNKPEWIDGIVSALAAIGVSAADPAFEGPYFQSANAARHREASLSLHEAGRAYYCDCTREALTLRTGSEHLGYDGFCRTRGLSYEPGRALRFRTPDEGETVVVDLVRGEPAFPNSAIEDFVIARGDGSPVFLLANVVDDLDEGITQVIRGEEHLSNTPKQQLLWQALDAVPPVWAHLPVIVNEKRQKLSKRRDKVALEDYVAEGYLPDALVNYLMLLGWGPGGDREILPYPELERLFRIEDVNASSAFFDVKKLTAFNGEYIRALSPAAFAAACAPWLAAPHAPWPLTSYDPSVFAAVAPLAQTRLALLSEITSYVDFLFLAEPVHDEASWAKAMKEDAPSLLRGAAAVFAAAPVWAAEPLKEALESVAAEHGLKLGRAQAPIRVAVTGRTVGLPLFESLVVLGRQRTLARLAAAERRLAAAGAS